MPAKEQCSHSYNHVFQLELIAHTIRRNRHSLEQLVAKPQSLDEVLRHLSEDHAEPVEALRRHVGEAIEQAWKWNEAAERLYKTAADTSPADREREYKVQRARAQARQAADALNHLETPIKQLQAIRDAHEQKARLERERQRLHDYRTTAPGRTPLHELDAVHAAKIEAATQRFHTALRKPAAYIGALRSAVAPRPVEDDALTIVAPPATPAEESSHRDPPRLATIPPPPTAPHPASRDETEKPSSSGDMPSAGEVAEAHPHPTSSTAPAVSAPSADIPSPRRTTAKSFGPDGVAALKGLREQALEMDLAGLALSGGGIRSATFALGVLQGLASLRLLGCFDYLSTVSGGGYIGAWLSAWIQREGSLANVEKQLDPSRLAQATADRQVVVRDPHEQQKKIHPLREVVNEEPEPIRHLRAYSRYLTPRPGIFSADTWTILSIYLRNLLINLLVVVPATMALILASRLLLLWFALPVVNQSLWQASPAVYAFSFAFAGLMFIALILLHLNRTRQHEAARCPNAHQRSAERGMWSMRFLLWSLIGSCICGLWIFGVNPQDFRPDAAIGETHLKHLGYEELNKPFKEGVPALVKFMLTQGVLLPAVSLFLFVVIGLWRLLRGEAQGLSWSDRLKILGFDAVRGLCLGLFLGLTLWLIWHISYPASGLANGELNNRALLTLGVPLILGAVILTGYAELALLGWALDEYEREWRSHLSAYLLMHAAAWLLFFGTTLYLPWALLQVPNDMRPYAGGILSGAWAAVSAIGAWVGRKMGPQRPSDWSDVIQRALATSAPMVFLLGLLASVSMLVESCATGKWSLEPFGQPVPWDDATQRWLWLLLALTTGASVWFTFCGNVNRFSLHMLYCNRLTRCYLGASRRKRAWGERVTGPLTNEAQESVWDWLQGPGGAPTNVTGNARRDSEVTGFDPADDLDLSQMQVVSRTGAPAYRGPYLLVNTALNLVAGRELATQDRKAESFVLTPDFFGSCLTGYESVAQQDEPELLLLSRAMTVSGAAVDPNMGILQSPPLTALLTVLNCRLGWWLYNPQVQRHTWLQRRLAKALLLGRELFGMTDERSSYIHLSDGGHFENLGVYELIRRRCRFIVVTDTDTDSHAASTNLTNLLRLVRTDFGIRIDIDLNPLERNEATGWSKWHCALGLIRYDDVDETAVAGVLVYVRATLTGNETPDVLRYAAGHPSFPRQTTADQFFDEAQFESYRVLGHHIALEVFGGAAARRGEGGWLPALFQSDTRRLFTRLRRCWFPPPPDVDGQFLDAAKTAIELETKLRTEPDLESFFLELYPEVGAAERKTELHLVNEMLQVMEMTWVNMNLDGYRSHPINRGWMNVFRRWTSAPTFHRFWPFLRGQFSQDFVTFCERTLNLRPTIVEQERLGAAIPSTLITALNCEFNQEWVDSLTDDGVRNIQNHIANLVNSAVLMAGECGLHSPFVWLLYLKAIDCDLPRQPCGIICTAPSVLCDCETSLEFFIWMRGPYRHLGLGRELIRDVRETILSELRDHRTPYNTLLTFFPKLGASNADRLEKAMWMNFFFDLNFRSRRLDSADLNRRVHALALDVSKR